MARWRPPAGGKPVPGSLLHSGWGEAEFAWMAEHGIDPVVVARYRAHLKTGRALTGDDLAEIATWEMTG